MRSGLKIRALAAGVGALSLFALACGDNSGKLKAEPKKPAAETPVAESKPVAPVIQTPVVAVVETNTRDLGFPADRSLGSLRTYDLQNAQWVTLGEAQGKVTVPKDAGITLIVSADGAKDLSPLGTLPADAFRQIVLDGLVIADDQLAPLSNFKELQKISFRAGQISDIGVSVLGEMRGLTEIDLAMTPITDAAIKPLVNLKQLDTLDISATNVGDAAIPDITAIQSLRTLDPQRSKITPEGVLKISEALPDCTIVER